MTQDFISGLNADAIYAGMRWFREFAESEAGKAVLARAMVEADLEFEAMRKAGVIGAADARMTAFHFERDSEVIAQIYPGEEDSVRTGIEAARFYLWGPLELQYIAPARHDDGPLAEAFRRFLADRAN